MGWLTLDKVKAVIKIILLTTFVALCTIYIERYVGRRWERPDIVVLGALPLHLYVRNTHKDGERKVTFDNHRLGLIFKVKNGSGADTIMNLAIIVGCVRMNPFAADISLPKKDRIQSGTLPTEAFWKARGNAVGRISVSGRIRDSSAALLPAYGTTYVPILFPFQGGRGGARFGAPGTVSLDGNCDKIRTANTQPSIVDVLDFQAIHYERPKKLRQEFGEGRLRVAIFAGNERVSIDPSKILPLRSISWKIWKDLDAAQMYENPDDLFPPTKSSHN